jgi:hypothetical protein
MPRAPRSDGSSTQTAVPVKSVREEYDWVRTYLPGFQFVSQELIEFEGRLFDRLTVQSDSGDMRRIFFGLPSESESGCRARGREGEGPPCPYCGSTLRSDKAKQCFECGTDWHNPASVVRRVR